MPSSSYRITADLNAAAVQELGLSNPCGDVRLDAIVEVGTVPAPSFAAPMLGSSTTLRVRALLAPSLAFSFASLPTAPLHVTTG